MDDGKNGDIKPVFVGSNRPDILTYTVGDLTTGLPYRFTVQAVNDNGVSEQSLINTFYACEAPSGFSPPIYVASDQIAKTISISWS